MNPCRVLVVEDDEVALRSLSRLLTREGYRITTAPNGQEAIAILASQPFDVVLTDLVMDPVDGLEVLAEAKRIDDETEVVILTGHASVDSAIQATRKGAFHYLQKPIRPDELRNVVHQAAEKRGLRLRLRELEQGTGSDSPEIIGNSPRILEIKKLIERIRDSDSPVMITGESGVGKELVARAIHRSSRRRGNRLLAFNCASFTEDLLANELFGHEKDAFTGATSTRAGLLESANGGTVFFDEVGDMPPPMQAKLLRVIQERELIRVGGTKPIQVDIRVIAATNKDLKRLSEAGIFRRDLFFRLNVIAIQMPSLSERRQDIPLLASHFLRRSCARAGKTVKGFSDETLGLLVRYGYPGNVRELENIVERATSFARSEEIEAGDLPPDLRDLDSFTFHHPTEKLKTLGEVEWEYIRWVLQRAGNNRSEAAKILGIDRVSLYRKLKRHEFGD